MTLQSLFFVSMLLGAQVTECSKERKIKTESNANALVSTKHETNKPEELKAFLQANSVLGVSDLRNIIFGYVGSTKLKDITLRGETKSVPNTNWKCTYCYSPVRSMDFTSDKSVLVIKLAGPKVRSSARWGGVHEEYKIVHYDVKANKFSGHDKVMYPETDTRKWLDIQQNIEAVSLDGQLKAVCSTNPKNSDESHLVDQHTIELYDDQENTLRKIMDNKSNV